MNARIAEEVRSALAAQKGVVALETSVVAQGLPYPQNLHAARACEEAIRRSGSTPAPIAVIGGEVCVGLSPEQMRLLAEGGAGALKIGARDLAMTIATKRSGGTTVSATCLVAASVGIRVFATGGIGGVHRGVAEHLDVSQDLLALARYPVAVVCAGVKAILDVPKTLEALETLAVPVIGIGTDELPAFYSRQSGLSLEHRCDSAEAAAVVVRSHLELAGQGGILFTLPPPEAAALPRADVELWIASALKEADRRGVRGKAVTPFLLAQVAERSGGRSLAANLALLENNSRFAGELAAALAEGNR